MTKARHYLRRNFRGNDDEYELDLSVRANGDISLDNCIAVVEEGDHEITVCVDGEVYITVEGAFNGTLTDLFDKLKRLEHYEALFEEASLHPPLEKSS